jgi:ACT domain-containing protein
MALNWEALADQIDRENSQATEAAFRKHGISSAAFYKWMAKYGGPGCRNSCW